MKTLKGTEKQIERAEQIIKDYMEAINQYKELSEEAKRTTEAELLAYAESLNTWKR